MGKKNKHDDNAKAIKRIDKALRDPDLKKKERKRLERLGLAAVVLEERRVEVEAHEPDMPEPETPDVVTEILDEARAVNEAGKRHLKHLQRIAELAATLADPEAKKKAKASAEEELKGYRDATVDRADDRAVEAHNLAEKALGGGHFLTSDFERAATDAKLAASAETDDDIKARVDAKRAARAAAESDAVSEVTEIAGKAFDKKKAKAAKGVDFDKFVAEQEAATPEAAPEPVVETPEAVQADEPTEELADPEAEQPRDRWGRPIIGQVDGSKAKGYRRTTTYIDVLDDKSSLIDWGRRIVVTGVAAIEQKIAGDAALVNVDEVGTVSVLERVSDANTALAKGAKAADKKMNRGAIGPDEHAAIYDELQATHKAILNDLVQEAFRAGDGFTKAETGTRIHKLMEVFDTDGPVKLAEDWDVTPSEWRDLNAIAAAYAALNVEVLAVEQFVVVDELEVGGTLDRRIRYDSPKLGRRISAIGDLKTGRVDFGAGKMTRQLAIYAKGKGYDWHKPEERVTYRTNQEVGLIFHIPAGSGLCEVYEIDLKKGWEGVQLCAKVYAHRSETTAKKVFDKVRSVKGESVE